MSSSLLGSSSTTVGSEMSASTSCLRATYMRAKKTTKKKLLRFFWEWWVYCNNICFSVSHRRNIPTMMMYISVYMILLVDVFVSEPSLLFPWSQWSTDGELVWFSYFTYFKPVGYFPDEVASIIISVLHWRSQYWALVGLEKCLNGSNSSDNSSQNQNQIDECGGGW